jgi:membrane protein YqaA with SNARE-associated domain
MAEVLGLFGVSVASALLPLINVEAYLVGIAALSESEAIWSLSLVGGVGQMVGKVVWYYLGANALKWGWVRRKVEKPKAQAKLELWRSRTHDRPGLASGLVLVSAVTGFPPFAVIAVLAGQLRMNLMMFVVVGTVGRTLRFAAVLGGAGWVSGFLT